MHRLEPAAHRGREVYWALGQIRNVLSREDYDLVNLSLGPEVAVDGDLFPREQIEQCERDELFRK